MRCLGIYPKVDADLGLSHPFAGPFPLTIERNQAIDLYVDQYNGSRNGVKSWTSFNAFG